MSRTAQWAPDGRKMNEPYVMGLRPAGSCPAALAAPDR